MRVITITFKAAFRDDQAMTIDGVIDVIQRGLCDGAEAAIFYTTARHEQDVALPDPHEDDDEDTWDDTARELMARDDDRTTALQANAGALFEMLKEVRRLTDAASCREMGIDPDGLIARIEGRA